MSPGDAPQHLHARLASADERVLAARIDGMDRPRKPRSNGGPEGPWWRRPIRPD